MKWLTVCNTTGIFLSCPAELLSMTTWLLVTLLAFSFFPLLIKSHYCCSLSDWSTVSNTTGIIYHSLLHCYLWLFDIWQRYRHFGNTNGIIIEVSSLHCVTASNIIGKILLSQLFVTLRDVTLLTLIYCCHSRLHCVTVGNASASIYYCRSLLHCVIVGNTNTTGISLLL